MRYYIHTHYSQCLQREMNIRVYGHYGKTLLVFPCQDGQSDDFDKNGMIVTGVVVGVVVGGVVGATVGATVAGAIIGGAVVGGVSYYKKK